MMDLEARKTKTDVEFQNLWLSAHDQARRAVAERAHQLGIIGHDGKHESALHGIAGHVGACGFAWVALKGQSAFLKWIKKQPDSNVYRDEYYGSGNVVYWVGNYNQCMLWKQTYAHEFAKVLRAAGLDAVARSRMD